MRQAQIIFHLDSTGIYWVKGQTKTSPHSRVDPGILESTRCEGCRLTGRAKAGGGGVSSKVEMVQRKYVTVTVKKLFSTGPEVEGARPSLAQVRNSSSEPHLLKFQKGQPVQVGAAWQHGGDIISEQLSSFEILTSEELKSQAYKHSVGFASCRDES